MSQLALHHTCRDSSNTDFEQISWAPPPDNQLISQIHSQQYALSATIKQNDSRELSKHILASYMSRVDQSLSSWIERLSIDSLQLLAHQRDVRQQAFLESSHNNDAVSNLINQIFDLLQTYSLNFNQTMGWNELRITCTKPSLVTEIVHYNKFREAIQTITHFRARLSTRCISLVIRGRERMIEFFLLPVNKVIGLSQTECEYIPVCQLEANHTNDKISWTIGDELLSNDYLELLCMDLFAMLIKQTQEELY